MAIPGPGIPGKLPIEVTVSIRGPLFEVTGKVLDLSPMGLEVLSPRRFPDAERVGLTISSLAVRGPGCIVGGEIGIQREQPGVGFFIRIDFVHSPDSEKNLQTFLWGVEEARHTKRREIPPASKGRGPRPAPASRVTPRGTSGGASPTFPPLKPTVSGRRPALTPGDASAGDRGKLPIEVTVSIRGPLFEVTEKVLDLSAMSLEMISPRRFPDSERVGLTISSMAVRGPGCIVAGEIGVQREQPGGGFFLRIDFIHSPESERNLQTFLWGFEEARQTKRRENPPGASSGRVPRSEPASKVTPRGSSGGAFPSFPPTKSPGSGRREAFTSNRDGAASDKPKLPFEVTASIRGPLFEVTVKVLDLSAMGLEVISPRRFPDAERVGLTISSLAVRGPGCVVAGEIGIQREQPEGGFFIRIDFVHSPESEKNLQTFLWGFEEARQTKRRENPPGGSKGRGRR